MYGKPCKPVWVAKVVFLIQILLTFGGRCNRYLWDIRLKMLRLPNFNTLFQLALTKFFKSELFPSLPKVDHVILQRAYRCLIRFNKPILWFTFAINDSKRSFQVRFLWMTTPRYLIESSLSRFSWSMTSLIPWQVCNLLSPPNNTNFDFNVFEYR